MTTDSLVYLLKEWAAYVRSGNHPGLGYAQRNIIHRMMKEGPGASQSTATVEQKIREDFEYIDKCYSMLHEKLKTSIYLHYIQSMSKRKSAKEMHENRERFRAILSQAESEINGYLKAKLK